MFASKKVNNMVRGGQTIDHVIGMAKQVISNVMKIGLVSLLSVIVLYYVVVDGPVFFKSFLNHTMAYVIADLNNKPNKNSLYITEFPKFKMINSGVIYNNVAITDQKNIFLFHFEKAFIYGVTSSGILIIFLFLYINKYGKDIRKDKHLRGSIISDVDSTMEIIKKLIDKDKYLSFGNVILARLKIPFQWEPQHFSLVGGSGTGKSVIFSYFITSIRKSEKRAIIHDRSGTYVKKFYNPKTDIILNPFDIRNSAWSLFTECKTTYHFEHVSEVLFPESKGDPFWYLAPRLVFTAMCIQESESDNPTTIRLIERVMRCTLKEIIEICKGTDAMTILDKDGVKLAQTIRSIIATNVRHFRIFDGKASKFFSLREWIKDESKSGFIFITSDKEKDVILKPIITLWLDISVATILSMDEKSDRRIWFLLDELQALGKLISLPVALAESRKYGGCFVLGFQGYSQACMIYTKDGVEALMDCISTFIFTRCNGANTSNWAENQLGKSEKVESNDTLSYGLQDVRDSQGQNNNRQNRSSVLASELQNLPDLHAYIRFGRGIPITKVNFPYVHYNNINEGIVDNQNDIDKPNKFNIIDGDIVKAVNFETGEFFTDVKEDSDSQMDSASLINIKKKKEKQLIYNMDFNSLAVEKFNAIPNDSENNVKYDDEFDDTSRYDFED